MSRFPNHLNMRLASPEMYSDFPIDLTIPRIKKSKRRSSFFDFDEPAAAPPKDLKGEEYIKKLENEKQIWMETINAAHEREKKAAAVSVYDSSILSNERKAYLEQAVNLKAYLKSHAEFASESIFFFKEKEFLERKIINCQELAEDKLNEVMIIKLKH